MKERKKWKNQTNNWMKFDKNFIGVDEIECSFQFIYKYIRWYTYNAAIIFIINQIGDAQKWTETMRK